MLSHGNLNSPIAHQRASLLDATTPSYIHLTSSTGCASTELSAFDRALHAAGIANFNLIRLSSVIPPGAEVVRAVTGQYSAQGRWGDRLYLVYADCRTSIPNESVWAGVGWVYDASGKGLFVEFEGNSEGLVRDSISSSLTDLIETRGFDAVDSDMEVVGATCVDAPVCALVAAIYQSESW